MNIMSNILESGHTFSDSELPLKFKIRLINTVMIIIVFTSTLFAMLHYLAIAPIGAVHSMANVLFAATNLLLIFWLRASKGLYPIILTLMIISALATFTSALVNVTNDEFRLIWFYILVLLAFFAGSVMYGYITALTSVAIILLCNDFFDLNYTPLAITTAVIGLIILTITVKVYTQKMIDLENALLTLNNSLNTKVQNGIEELRKKDEYMLQQARMAQMGEMIAMIAHQWRQPLTSISSISANIQLSLALDETIDKAMLSKMLHTIDERTALLSKTIDDFKNFYNNSKQKERFSLNNTIEQAIEILSPAINDASVHVTVSCQIKSEVYSFESEIIQVLMNIIKNAIDVLQEREGEKSIYIGAYQDSTNTYVVIEDNGGGVDLATMQKIFDPYFATKKEKNGMGLGLYMSRLIIHEHCGGSLKLHNTNQGAVFTIELPLQQK